ncbi:MAG: hypothetical protein WCS24_05045, partial [Methanoculleus sp.]
RKGSVTRSPRRGVIVVEPEHSHEFLIGERNRQVIRDGSGKVIRIAGDTVVRAVVEGEVRERIRLIRGGGILEPVEITRDLFDLLVRTAGGEVVCIFTRGGGLVDRLEEDHGDRFKPFLDARLIVGSSVLARERIERELRAEGSRVRAALLVVLSSASLHPAPEEGLLLRPQYTRKTHKRAEGFNCLKFLESRRPHPEQKEGKNCNARGRERQSLQGPPVALAGDARHSSRHMTDSRYGINGGGIPECSRGLDAHEENSTSEN